jgi:ribonuclease D
VTPDLHLVAEKDLPDLRKRLRDAQRVAVDTEFHAERRYLPKLFLVQLRLDDGTTWIIDPKQPGHLHALAEPLCSTDWIVHGGTQDMRLLLHALGALPDRVWDTQIAAGLLSEDYPAPYTALLKRYLGVEIEKLATLSDWSRRPLTHRQLCYAAEDVQLLLQLWDRLWEQIRDLERTEIVAGACEEARTRVVDPPPTDLTWRGIGAARALSPQEAAILQELSAWREETARVLDQPPRFIMGDGIMAELARRQPITRESLAANRRLPKSLMKRWASEILDRIQRASRRPEWAWPHPISEVSPARRTTRWLECFARLDGHAHAYAARLVLPTTLAEDLAADRPATRELLANQLGPWRDALVGKRLWKALSGQICLRIGPRDLEMDSEGAP